MRTFGKAILVGLLTTVVAPATTAGQAATTLTADQQREFLLKADVIASRPAGKGITGSLRLTLSDGSFTHDAGFQSIDDRTSQADRVRGRRRAGELNFADSYKYNIAAYEIARLIGLDDMMPVTVERRIKDRIGSLSWWVDDVMMDEVEREKSNAQPPDSQAYSRQHQRMITFAELVRDVDRNKGNVLYTKGWRVVMIDFSRAFRLEHELRFPETLQTCERKLYDKLRNVADEDIRRAVGDFLTRKETEGVLARRKLIVARFDRLIRERGETLVLHDNGI